MAEYVTCHHPNAERRWSSHDLLRVECPDCGSWAVAVVGVPVLAPTLLLNPEPGPADGGA